jgi:hypothetical protein
MIDAEEKSIKPPTSPLTAKINMAILQYYFDYFIRKFLPAYKVVVTSGYREPSKNAEVGGAENSAHLHGLAYDFILQYQNGEAVSKQQAKKVFEEFIQPNWPGFSLWEETQAGVWHVHANLSRRITEYASIMGIVAIGVVGIQVIKSLGDSK